MTTPSPRVIATAEAVRHAHFDLQRDAGPNKIIRGIRCMEPHCDWRQSGEHLRATGRFTTLRAAHTRHVIDVAFETFEQEHAMNPEQARGEV